MCPDGGQVIHKGDALLRLTSSARAATPMWPSRFLIFKVVIERLFPCACGNSFGVPPDHIAGIDVPTIVPTAIVPNNSISFMVRSQGKPPWISGKVGEKCSGHVVYGETY